MALGGGRAVMAGPGACRSADTKFGRSHSDGYSWDTPAHVAALGRPTKEEPLRLKMATRLTCQMLLLTPPLSQSLLPIDSP